MDNVVLSKLINIIQDKEEDKKIVSFFVNYTMEAWKENWKTCQKLFKWITIDDFKTWESGQQEKLFATLLADDLFLKDIQLLIDTYTELYIEKTKKAIRRVGAPETLEHISHKSVADLQKELSGIVSTSSMGRKIRNELNKRGVYGKSGRKN